jgi:hypothetical protein
MYPASGNYNICSPNAGFQEAFGYRSSEISASDDAYVDLFDLHKPNSFD